MLIEQAARVLTAAREQTLYARVDGVVRDDQFQLLELELVVSHRCSSTSCLPRQSARRGRRGMVGEPHGAPAPRAAR
jgi:hypothetical protein